MRQSSFRSMTTTFLAAVLVVQAPAASFAFAPPMGGHGGSTVSGVVVDSPRDEPRRGRVVDGPTNNNSIWILAGAGVALAILVNGGIGDSSTPLGDCADLFDDLFDGENTAQQAGCDDRAAAAFFGPLLMAAVSLPDPGASLPHIESRLAATLMPEAAAQDPINLLDTYHTTGQQLLARGGQSADMTVKVALDDYLMPGKTYPVTFTVTAPADADLSQPLFLIAGDLAQAGSFPHEIGFPFAVPVDMDALRANGSWSYSTPFKAEAGGAYYIDSLVSDTLPRNLKPADDRGIGVIDLVQQDLQRLERKLAATSGKKAAALAAERDRLSAHLVWLLEWQRQQ